MTYSSSEEGYYKRHSLTPASTSSYIDSGDKERASIWSFSTVDEDPDYPRPTRLYQCALVFAGFMATFQTIGANQTYGIFQASPSAGRLRQFLYELLYERYFFEQEYYTSPGSKIVDGPGQYALASLVGTIGGGLTWSGSILVSLIISKGFDLCLMCLTGSALMSLGFILASFATRVCAAGFSVPTFD